MEITNLVAMNHELELVLEAIDLIKRLEKENGFTEEEILLKYTSGFCDFLAEDVKIYTTIACENNGFAKPQIFVKTFDVKHSKAGGQISAQHCFICVKNPNFVQNESNIFSPNRFLYIDISGIYTYDEVLKRIQSDCFENANKKIMQDEQLHAKIFDKQRNSKIEHLFRKNLESKTKTKS